MPPEEQEDKQEPKEEQEEEQFSDRIAIQLRQDPAEAKPDVSEESSEEEEDEEGYALDGVTLDDVFEVVCGMEEVFAGVTEPLKKIESELVARITNDKAKDKAFDALYEEMRQYKENFLMQAQKPLYLDLILLYDQIARSLEAVEDQTGLTEIENIRDELLEILYRRDVEPMAFDDDAKFDRELMKAIKRIDVEEEAEDKKIDRVSRSGFTWNEKVLRPHEVVVKRFKKSGDEKDEDA